MRTKFMALAAAAVAALFAFPGAAHASELGTDIVIGGGVCEDKDVVIIIPDPISDESYRICFDYPA